jgi:hypothetical protein
MERWVSNLNKWIEKDKTISFKAERMGCEVNIILLDEVL